MTHMSFALDGCNVEPARQRSRVHLRVKLHNHLFCYPTAEAVQKCNAVVGAGK